jgi:hypothetical protein
VYHAFSLKAIAINVVQEEDDVTERSEHKSEVARLLQQIEQECVTARSGLHGYAVTARHEFITARLERMGACHEALVDLVGKEEATRIVVEVMEKEIR